ncbi:Ig-like domain-containing protein [Glaciihabitans tibetensis]|nr:Ig-like domain-containing protein [Glaciihabitans tibetensis]
MSSRWTPLHIRLRSAVRATTLGRVAAVAAIAVIAAPLLAIVLLVGLGAIVGDGYLESAALTIGWASTVGVVVAGIAVLMLLFGIIAVAAVVVRPRVGGALLTALRALPRLLAALVLVIVAILLAAVAWPLLVVGALVTALALRVRGKSGVRRALVCGIPLLPLVFAVALVPAVIAASLERPRGLRGLLRAAVAIVTARWLPLLANVIVAAGVSTALTWAGTAASSALEGAGHDGLGLLATAVALALLVACLGFIVAVILPPTTPVAPITEARRGWRLGSQRFTQVAMLVVAAMVLAIVPGTVSAPASAAVIGEPVLTASITPSATSDGSLFTVSAEVDAADASDDGTPAGSVQFFDGDVAFGLPTALVASDIASIATAALVDVSLEVGERSFRFEYTPADATASVSTSGPVVQTVEPAPTTAPAPEPAPDTAPVPAPTAAPGAAPAVAPSPFLRAVAAATSVTAAFSTTSIEYGIPAPLSVTVASSLDGPRTLEVRNTATNALLSSEIIQIVSGAAAATVNVTGLRPGNHVVSATVVGDGLNAEATATAASLRVTTAPTTMTLMTSQSGMEFGKPVTFSASVRTSTGATPTVGRVTFYAGNKLLGSAAVNASRSASFTWIPTADDLGADDTATIVAEASYFDSSFLYSGSSGTTHVQLSRVQLPAPSMIWSGDLSDPLERYLTVTYPAAEGRPVPSGVVQLSDVGGAMIAREPLINGSVQFRVILPDPFPPLGIEFLSNTQGPDRTYAWRGDMVPDLVLPPYTPSVSVSAPMDVFSGTPFAVNVDVTNVPVSTVSAVMITDTAPNGDVRTIGSATLDQAGHGDAVVTIDVEGAHKIGAAVFFTPQSEMATAYSSTVPVTVAAPVRIVPNLVVTSRGDPVAGGAILVQVTAEWIAPGSTGLAVGAIVDVRDGNGAYLGQVTLNDTASGNGYRGELRVSNLRPGALSIVASASYGTLGGIATSAPLVIVVAAPETTLALNIPSVVVGQTLNVGITAYPSGGYDGLSRSQAATVVIDGMPWKISLTRGTGTDPFRGTVSVPTSQVGSLNVTASIPGDGIDTSAASTTATASVLIRPTSVSVVMMSSARAGEPVTVSARIVQEGPQRSPAPTGTLTVAGVRCVQDVPCVIPGSEVRTGINTFTAVYSGDSNNTTSTSQVTFTAAPRTSALTVSFSPTIEDWVYGEPITATWSTRTSAQPASGTVAVTIANAACSGPALAGSCTLTPTTKAVSTPITTNYSVRFVSFDGAPPATVDGTTQSASLCVYPFIDGTVDYTSATRCGGNQTGVRTGSTLRVTPIVAEGNIFDHWTLNGADLTDRSVPLVLVITGETTLMAVGTLPVVECFTLQVTPSRIESQSAGGRLTAITAPNCTDPNMPTAEEIVDWNNSRPRYAAGTVVYVRADARTEEPKYVLDGPFVGATMVNEVVGKVTMDADRTVSATFSVQDCVRTDFLQPDGGNVSLLSAVRPLASANLLPATGECVAYDGSPGYVPGTRLSVIATADDDTVLESWLTSSGIVPLTDEQRKVVSVGRLSQTKVERTLSVEVPETARFEVTARFSRVECVSVTVISRSLIASYETTEERVPEGAFATGWGTETGCGGIAEERTSTFTPSGFYHVKSVTNSFVASGRVDVETDEARVSARFGGRDFMLGASQVYWSTDTTTGLSTMVHASRGDVASLVGRADGPVLDLEKVVGSITVTADWSMLNCAAPNVTLPQGGGFVILPGSADEPFCNDKNLIAPGQTVELNPIPINGAPGLTALTTDVTSDTYVAGVAKVVGTLPYRLEYCAPLGVEVRIHDDSGAVTIPSRELATALVEDDGGCPPLWTRHNRTTKTVISAEGEFGYSVIGNAEGIGPVRTVSAAGVVSGPTEFNLQTVCFTLSVGDASITTAGNCPGGAANRFLRGAQVELQAEDADRFDGWEGVDAEEGETAWVIIDRDRYVEADIHNYSDVEKLGNVLSSVAGRVVSAVMTFATGVLLANAFVVKAAGWALKGVAVGLRAIGAGGAVADGFDKGSQVIAAQFDALSLLSTCLNKFAHGESVLDSVSLTPGTVTVSKDSSPAELVAAMKTQLANDVAGKGGAPIRLPGSAVFGKLAGDEAAALVNAFLSNPSMYTGDARDQWNGFGDKMTSCVETGAKKYLATTYSGY